MMSSRPLQNNPMIRTIMVVLLIGAVSIPVTAADKGPVAVFLSADEEAYKRPVEVFMDEMKMPMVSFNLEGEIKRAKGIMKDILAQNPSLIFAVGAKAAAGAKYYSVKMNRKDVPIVFAMVLNWERYKLTDGVENVAGIAADVDPGTQIANLQMYAPNASRIGAIYSNASAQIIQKAEMMSAMLGLELFAEKIEDSREFRGAYKNLVAKNIKALWVPSDPLVFTVRNMDWAERSTVDDRIVMMGQSENIARQGALLAVSMDVHSIGVQASSIAKNIIEEGQSPQSIGVMPPLGTKLILNTCTAKKIGLEISDMAKSMAAIIIEECD